MKHVFTLMLLLLLPLAACDKSEAPTTTPSTTPEPSVVEIPDHALQALQNAWKGMPEALNGMNAWPIDSLPPSLSDTNYEVYSVTMVWGELVPPNPTRPPIDWTGTLSVNGVAIIDVLSAIDFENADGDHLIAFDNPAITGWASFTNGDIDGISCLVFLDKRVTYITAPLLTFDTGPFEQSWDFGELEHFTEWYEVTNSSGVAIHAQRLRFQNSCPRGLLSGTWERGANNPDSGYFSGLWQDHAGEPMHYFAGTFWKTSDGRGVWEGWISGLITDDIKGWMEGTWAYDDLRLCPLCGQSYGYMHGNFRWHNEDEWSGKVAARFGGPDIVPSDTILNLHGAWKERCNSSDAWGLIDVQ